jgi:hypothetical protein
MAPLIAHLHRQGVTQQVVRPTTRRQLEAAGHTGALVGLDGVLLALWTLRPLRNGCGLLAIRPLAVPAELWCPACERFHPRTQCHHDDDGATVSYHCTATGQLLGQF